MSRTVLVTGGLGFIGSNLVDILLEKGDKVVIFDNESTGHNHNKHENCTTIIGSITEDADLAKLPTTITHVVHLGAKISVAESMTHEEEYHQTNVGGTQKVLDWCVKNKVQKFVCASSAATYGDVAPENLPLVEATAATSKRLSPYAENKYENESQCKKVTDEHGLPTCALRFFNVFGPRQDPKSQYSGVISKFMEFATTNVPLKIFGDGSATRDFVYVADIAQAICLFLEKGTGHAVYNVARGSQTTVQELAETVIRLAGATSMIEHLAPREGDILHSCANISHIKNGLGYEPKVSFEQGLEKTLAWFKEGEGN